MCYFSVPGLEGHDSIILYTTRVETMDMALYVYIGQHIVLGACCYVARLDYSW